MRNTKDTEIIINNLESEISELKLQVATLTSCNNKLSEIQYHTEASVNNQENYDNSISDIIAEYQNDLITIFDSNYKLIWANNQYLKTLGLTQEDVIDNSIFLNTNPGDKEIVMKSLKSLTKPPHTSYHKERKITKNGWKWFEWSLKSITDTKGQIIKTVAVGKSIQECKELNNHLETSLLRYQKAQKIGNVGNWEFNIISKQLWGSEEAKRIYGFNLDDKSFSTDDVGECIPKRDEVYKSLVNLIENNLDYDIEYDIITHNTKEKKTIHSIAECERDEKGNPIKVSGVIRDITEKKRIKDELINSKERYKTLVTSINDIVFLLDEDDHFVDVHNNIESPLLINSNEFLGKKLTDVIPKHVSELYSIYSNKLRKHHKRQKYEYNLSTKDGIGWYSATLNLYKDTNKIVAGIKDITKSKNKEQRYSQILQSAMDGFWLIDENGKILDVNKTTCSTIQYTKNELLKMHIYDIDILEDITDMTNHFRQVVKKGHEYFETKHRRKDGGIIDVEISATTLKVEENFQLAVFSRNITERKKNHQTILDSQNMMQTILMNMPAGFILIDEEYIITQVNEHTCSITGYSEEELVGSFCDIICPKGAASKSCPIWARGEDGFRGMDTTVKHKNKYLVPVLKNSQRISIQGKNYIMENFVDISKRVKFEKKLYRTDELLRKIIDTAPNNIFIKDREGKYLIANKTIADSHNTTVDEIIGKYDRDLTYEWFNTKNYKTYRTKEQKIIDDNKPYYEASAPFTFNDGTIKHFQTLKVPIEMEDGTKALLTSSVDITNSIELNEKLRIAKDKAEESDKLKSAFLANMSHEIRTPMNGILGFSSLLKNQDLTGEQRDRYITIIQRSGARMLNIINDLIDISRIEAGQVEVKLSTTDIINQLDYLYNFFKPEVEEKNMALNLYLPEGINSLEINTDREKLYAILTNFIKNSIKYTNEGKIDIYLKLTNNKIIFSVKDTGIGIPSDRINAIFDRFVQADIEDKKALEGAGLGLAICKAYANMIGAEISVVSEDNIGSEFSLTMPNTTM